MDKFHTQIDRKHTRSVKWDMLKDVFDSEDVLPMWVADMDFKAPDAVNQALVERARHGIYGYTIIDEDVKDAITDWIAKRHHWTVENDWLSFSPGVVTGLHIAIQALTEPNDKVLIQTPVYTPFYNVIESHGREIVRSPLLLKDNYYHIDFKNLEEKLASGVSAFILCSPHNPVGRVWKREELEEVARLCLKHDVTILADEIHADLIFPGEEHIPIASLSHDVAQKTVTFMSPSKTFNLAGLQASYMITSNETMKKDIDAILSRQGLGMLNTMGNTAMEVAYRKGEGWLDELRGIIKENYDYVRTMLHKHAPALTCTKSEGTYLLWIDCSGLGLDHESLAKFMIEKAGVGFNKGITYGEEGAQFMRMNLACPMATVEEAVRRLIDAVNK